MFLFSFIFFLAFHHSAIHTTATHILATWRISIPNDQILSIFSKGPGDDHQHYPGDSYKLKVRGGDNIVQDEVEDEKEKNNHKRSVKNSRRKKKAHHTTSKASIKSQMKKRKLTEKDDNGRKKINETMKRHKDTASMLGDAIRDRANDLIRNTPSTTRKSSPFTTFQSLGLALGASDTTANVPTISSENERHDDDNNIDEDVGGGVEASTSAVLANYFLHTHGGAHGIQSLLSLSSVVTSLGAWMSSITTLIPTKTVPTSTKVSSSSSTTKATDTPLNTLLIVPNRIKLALIRRTLFFAGLKHISGILSGVIVSARQIPQLGLTQVRQAIEELIQDPVAQYFFYCTLILFWIGIPPDISKDFKISSPYSITEKNTMDISSSWSSIPWWLQSSSSSSQVPSTTTMSKKNQKRQGNVINSLATLSIVGPIFIREFVSIIWVLSDVLVILSSNQPMAFQVWKFCGSIVDAGMSVVFTPSVWRQSNLVTRQKLLAELVSRISLLFEVIMGILIVVDALKSFWTVSLAPLSTRSSFWHLVQRLVCAKLYIQFLLVRKQRISELISIIRGGAVYLPDKVLDTLLDPKKAMGLDMETLHAVVDDKAENSSNNNVDQPFQTLIKWIGILLGV